MKADKAKRVRTEIEKLCEKYGLYYESSKSCKPCLKNITITVTVKVDDK